MSYALPGSRTARFRDLNPACVLPFNVDFRWQLLAMRIAEVAPLYESVPPRLYGGTERVVSYLTEELVRLGHDVTLFASGDSVTSARRQPFGQRALRLDPSAVDGLASHMRMLAHVYRRAAEFDIIHCHTDYLGLHLAHHSKTPTVITLHGRLDIPELEPLYCDFPEVSLVSISNTQRAYMPRAPWVATVHHGLPPELFTFQPRPGSYLLFLGRISPEKGVDAAIRVARHTKVPLRIAAKVDRVDQAYFESTIRPLLDGPEVEYLGEVDDRRKNELLGGALALIFPIDWPEPFGLVMIEALACGTPVIARRRGSVPEVIRHGETGFVVETEDEMVEAVARARELDRIPLRREFERRFNDQVMAEHYLEVYRRILSEKHSGGLRIPAPLAAAAGAS
jgi:glycosyltransferase involved in cell wall biosynthesis